MTRISSGALLASVLLPFACLASEGEHTIVEVKRRTGDKTWKRYETVTLEHVRGFRPRRIELGRFGGRTDRRAKATGFFRTEEIDGRWEIVDPDGCLWYSVGSCSVRPNPTEQGRRALAERFGTAEGWARATTDQLRANGFNTLGCWSQWEQFRDASPRLAYTTQSYFMSSYGKKRGGTYQKPGHTGYPDDCIFVFDPEFEAFCRDHARKLLAPVKDDPFCFGHFSDNEMPFRDDALDRYMKLGAGDPGRKAAEDWIAKRGVKRDGKGYSSEDREAFLGHLSDTYFGVVARAIREADPNHLYLGARFHGGDLRRRSVVEGAGPHVDIVSFNWYGTWTPDRERMDNWLRWSRKPFIITEWYAKGMDGGMGNVSGAGFTVKTQADRGRFYENFTLALLGHPGCVGWHWFKYMDNDPTDTSTDPSNRDSNKGFVNYLYEPWTDLLEAMERINSQVYALRDHLCR